ncbi:MAG: RsmD family RNA methyltransferase [Polyangiaceae bacterium]
MQRPVERSAHEIAKRGPYDLVLVDPPYAAWKGAAKEAVEAIVKTSLAEGAMVVLEYATRDGAPTIEGLREIDHRTYGDTSLVLLDRAEDVEVDAGVSG